MASRTTALLGIAALAACSRGEPSLESAAATSAVESGIPAPLLLAIASAESRATTDGPGQWIRLMRWRTARDPRRVAARLGLAVDALADDPAASLRAAAALLADAARVTGVDRDAPLRAWRPALERFAGGRNPLANQLYADQVLALLGVEPPGAAAAHLPERPADLVGAAFASYVPLSDAAHRPMPATQRRPRFIIVHTMQNTFPVILEYFHRTGTNVGAHYLVDSVAGTTVQMADERLVVFHDACFNEESIGIEHEGYVEAGKRWYSDDQLRASARLVRDIARRHDIPLTRQHILGHGEAPDCSDHTDPGPEWDWDRFMAYVAAPE
jgi:hypothetical protein